VCSLNFMSNYIVHLLHASISAHKGKVKSGFQTFMKTFSKYSNSEGTRTVQKKVHKGTVSKKNLSNKSFKYSSFITVQQVVRFISSLPTSFQEKTILTSSISSNDTNDIYHKT
jgi:hypothetical protein